MEIQIDFRSGLPIYAQIVDQIQKRIASGELNPGDQLPTVRQLAADLRVNFNTVARAYRLLDEGGVISTQHGRGTYVWDSPSEESKLRIRNKDLKELTVQFIRDMTRSGFSLEEIGQELKEALAAQIERNK